MQVARRALKLGLLIAFALGIVTAHGCNSRAQREAEGHGVMLKLLAEYRETAGQLDPFEDRSELRRVLSALKSDGSASTSERFDLLQTAGDLELRLGNNQEAIDHLSKAHELAQQSNGSIDEERAHRAVFRLAVAWLRLAETENCVHCRTGESCILPIREGGVHQRTAGTEKAVEYFRLALQQDPNDLTARWLLNIAAMNLGIYPQEVAAEHRVDPGKFTSPEAFPRFKDIAQPLGLDTNSLLGGAVADDFDNDGRIDVIVSGWKLSDQLRYFRNRGDGGFEDRTEAAGLIGILGGGNLVQADYDNDGDLDLLVLRGGWNRGKYANSLLRNDGKDGFRDVTFASGLGEQHVATQTAAWDDFDLDGDLDLYVGNEQGESQLFVNDGKGGFLNRARQADVENGRMAKGVVWGDFNGDRFPDLYVSNFNEPNRLYQNDRDGTFTDVAPELSVTEPLYSFPVWFWDFNNDGKLDLFAPSYDYGTQHVAAEYFDQPIRSEPDRLWQQVEGKRFRDVADEVGLDRVTQPMGANFGDLDNDGFLDFYLGTGYPEYEALMPNVMFRNRSGERFVDVTSAGGFGHLQKGHGIAFADFDNDGDQDVLIELGGAYPGDAFGNALFENPGFDRHWIRIKLIGRASNRCGIGARLRLDIEDNGTTRSIYRWVNSGGSFGANPLTQQIGLGKATSVKRLRIYWPKTGKTQSFENVAADQFLQVEEGASSLKASKLKAFSLKKQAP